MITIIREPPRAYLPPSRTDTKVHKIQYSNLVHLLFIAESNRARYRIEGDDPISRYQCPRYYKIPSRQGFQLEAVKAGQEDDARRQYI